MLAPPAPLRLVVDRAALTANWRAFAAAAGPAACGAAVKAEAYGLGATTVVDALTRAGCRDFYVTTWAEAAALERIVDPARVAVLHGVQDGEMAWAKRTRSRPVLNTPAQIVRWRTTGRPCDVMVDTGMNRLGLSPAEAVSGLLDGLALDTLHSHLACADEPAHPLNVRQRTAFADIVSRVKPPRAALANSAGVCLGPGYAFDLVRPGLGLYGGGPGPAGPPVPVVSLETRVVQRRRLAAGDTIGYGATFTAAAPTEVAIVNIGYADGYPRALSSVAPALGRVSMDLVAIDVTGVDIGEADWLPIPFDLPALAAASGRSQYELLTGLGGRYDRTWR